MCLQIRSWHRLLNATFAAFIMEIEKYISPDIKVS